MKRIISVVPLILALLLTGCVSLTGQNSIDRTNDMIIEANRYRLESYGNAMVACGDNAACQVGVSLAFAGNLGQQQLYRHETVLDWMRELRMWIDPIDRIVARVDGGGGYSGDRAANVVRGDGNVILVGNRASADNGSTASFSLNPSFVRSWDGYNRDYTGVQPISDAGVGEAVQ